MVSDRIRGGTMGAEGVLHDLGVIGITSSDAQGMGRAGETVRRTFQLAARMKQVRRSGSHVATTTTACASTWRS
jgi:urease subunit alpha